VDFWADAAVAGLSLGKFFGLRGWSNFALGNRVQELVAQIVAPRDLARGMGPRRDTVYCRFLVSLLAVIEAFMATQVAPAVSTPAVGDNVVVETRNLSKIYRDFWGRQKVRALKPLDLSIYRGEIFGLLGPNGSGKTTTIKLLLGLLFPTTGQALVFGRDATDVAKNERLGFLPEESYLYRFLNAEETLDFYGRLFNMPSDVRRRRTAELIDLVGLNWAKRRQLREYSKGMARRIGLAQALINDPELILLDEPTSGLDPIGTREMKDLILKLKAEGKTVVMCSHLLADVQDVCDRIAILHQGELKELGRVDSLLRMRDLTQIRASGLNDEAKAEIRAVIERHHGTLASMDNPTTTLEELFLSIVRDSEARPGRRGRHEEDSKGGGTGG
jgi:ABC-2 type transport system ATP-binding protein